MGAHMMFCIRVQRRQYVLHSVTSPKTQIRFVSYSMHSFTTITDNRIEYTLLSPRETCHALKVLSSK